MSSKGRGADVVASEFYPTPKWCTRRILEALGADWWVRGKMPRSWLEPCCGDGAILAELSALNGAHVLLYGDVRGVNLPPYLPSAEHCGFDAWEGRYDAVITNPPFSLAVPLIQHFLPRCDWLILLLRSSFKLASIEGGPDGKGYSFRDNMPDEYRLPQRPEFIASEKCKGGPGAVRNNTTWPELQRAGCGWSRKVALTEPSLRICPGCGGKVQRSQSDSSEYSWFVWTPERNRARGYLQVLPDTSLEERRQR